MSIVNKYINDIMEKSKPGYPYWNKEVLLQNKEMGWNYIDGCMIKCILDLYDQTTEEKYLEFADSYIDHFVDDEGKILGYNQEDYNLDFINEGKVLFRLSKYTNKPKYALAIDTLYEQIKHQPRTPEGNFWHKKIYDNQVWLDGIYMSLPFYLEYENNHGFKNYNDIFNQLENVKNLMKDSTSDIPNHAYDSSRKSFWCDKQTGLSHTKWLRSIGWYSMALIDMIELVDTQMYDEYMFLVNEFRDLIKAELQYQDQSGMFYQVIDQMERPGNYLETSGSAMIGYAIYKGCRLGILPPEYKKFAKSVSAGIDNQYLKSSDQGLSLGGICLVAGLGPEDNKRRDGTFEYYISEPIVEDDAKGIGPYIMMKIEEQRTLEGSSNVNTRT
ncbi:glycoside hydrolase family 88 protein [Mollicutes bacterium LVI A0039]|nr:glycoside hydrolase family 88 protein [Mollicutes bacterium LVI A0039]